MRLLIDSSGLGLVCGLAEEGAERVVAEITKPAQQGEAIDAVVGELLGHCTMADIYAIVVGTGPGSFIGTRTAISFANGFAAASDVQLHAVNSLAAMAAATGELLPVLRDARRGQWYLWTPDNECVAKDEAGVLETLTAGGFDRALIEWTGEEEPGFAQVLRSAGLAVEYTRGVTAEGLLRAMAGNEPQQYVEPVYLRGFT